MSKSKETLKKESGLLLSKSMGSLELSSGAKLGGTNSLIIAPSQIGHYLQKAQSLYMQGAYTDCLQLCEKIYDVDAYRLENLLLLGAVHFQLRNYSESVFYNQQSIRVDPHFAEAYSNLGNALKELGDLKGATQFYLKVSRAMLDKLTRLLANITCFGPLFRR